jgi:hypothetical protein
METELSIAEIEEGHTNEIKEWYSELEKREEETYKTLEQQGVVIEEAYVAEIQGTSYLLVYMASRDLERAHSEGDKENFEIVKEHHEVLEKCRKTGSRQLEEAASFQRLEEVHTE